ncbi:MAG: hypothetical protein EA384_16270 [Spirochaetaceae bacterium]|nr:MAG: hypothetical protein EA384_16270 [Spirochaetaceae bacterium]
MALPTGIEKLHSYLRAAQRASDGSGSVHYVIGNEAADLDSMASAVMYAYYAASTAGGDAQAAVLPLIDIPRADFKLRTEAVYLFSEAGIDPQLLLFADDVDLDTLHEAGKLKLTLIDHNKPAAARQGLSDCVTAIIDHHKDESLFNGASPRIIEPVGSAATLVAELILKTDQGLLEEGSARLLLGTILLDTVNLDPEAKRATPKDQHIVDTLLALTGADQQKLFEELQQEKFNVSALDSADLLRKDYKEWTLGGNQVGIASVLLPVADWLKKDPTLPDSLAGCAAERGLDVLIAMNAYTDPGFTRELVVYCPDESLRTRLLDCLNGSDLQLKPIDSSRADESTALFAQGNLAYSRKKLQPLLSDFFAGLA